MHLLRGDSCGVRGRGNRFSRGLVYSLDEVRSGCARGDNGAMRVHARRERGRTNVFAPRARDSLACGGFS